MRRKGLAERVPLNVHGTINLKRKTLAVEGVYYHRECYDGMTNALQQVCCLFPSDSMEHRLSS